MAKQVTKVTGLLSKKLGTAGQKAFQETKGNETKYGQMELPAGIESGIAQLVECKFAEHEDGENKGKVFFYAAGIVVEPKEFTDKDGQTHKTEGMRTSITEPIYDTPTRSRKSVQDHLDHVMNEMRKLGASTEDLQELDNLELVAAGLKEAKPFFHFRTWKGEPTQQYPNPRTNSQWIKQTEYDPKSGEGVSADVVDESPAANEEPAAAVPSDEAAPPAEDYSGAEVSDLVAKANEGDEAAQAELRSRAIAAGSSDQDVDAAPDWEAVGALASATAAEAPAEAEWKPVKGDVYKYTVIDANTKKPVVDPKTKKPKKAVEVEVQAVNEKAKTVDLKNMDDPKALYKGVSWDALEQA